jgi:hypothetical protein
MLYVVGAVKDCIDSCKHNIMGKIISNKPIDIQAKQNAITGI